MRSVSELREIRARMMAMALDPHSLRERADVTTVLEAINALDELEGVVIDQDKKLAKTGACLRYVPSSITEM